MHDCHKLNLPSRIAVYNDPQLPICFYITHILTRSLFCLFVLFFFLAGNSKKMDSLPPFREAFFIGYAVAKFLINTNRQTKSTVFYSECLVLWNQLPMSKRKYFPLNVIEQVIRQNVVAGESFLIKRGLECYDFGQIKESINCFEKALCIQKQHGFRLEEAWCHCHLGRSLHVGCQYDKAMEHYQKALGISEITGYEKQELEGAVYNHIGEVYHIRGSYETARHYYEKALRINKEIGIEIQQATSYNNLGVMSHNCLGKLNEALAYHEKALEIRKRLGYRKDEGTSYNNIGGVYEARGDYKKALEYYERSLALSIEIKDRVLEGRNLYFIGKVYGILAQHKKAVAFHKRALEIRSETGGRKAGVLTDLGNSYMALGEYEKAIEHHKLGIKLCEEIGDLECLDTCYNNLGLLYSYLGEGEKAKEYLEKSIDIRKKTGSRVSLANQYCNISQSCMNSGQYQKSRDYAEEALKISRETGHIREETAALLALGNVFLCLGKNEKATEYAEKALRIAKEIGEKQKEVSSFVLLGSIHFAQGHNENAIWYQNKALEMMKEIGIRDQGQFRVLHTLGLAYSSQGELSKACDVLLEGIKIHQSTRSSLQDETTKLSLDDKNFSCYRTLSWLLLRQGKFNDALFTLELGRSRTLVDLMWEKYGIKDTRGENEVSLSALQGFLRKQERNFLFIAIRVEPYHEIALWFVDKGGNIKFKFITVDLTRELSKENNVAEESGVDFSTLTLDDDAQYEDRSLAALYDDGPLASVEQRIKPNKNSVQIGKRKQIGNKSYLEVSFTFKSYSAFIAPILDLIDSPEIIISPEPCIFLTPFASLKDDNGKYLCETVRVRLIPSLTTLKLIHDSPVDYHSQSGALIVGEPKIHRVELNGNVRKLCPLPKAREEAQMVSRLVGVPCLVGEEATKEEVLRRIQDVSLVHIAAHGDADTGEIALAPNSSVIGVPKIEDVLLTMNDIAQVGIRAKLVVLSCCHSARGKILTAEGVVGIARAFLASGARSVLMSLWAVDDEATKAFMNIFYKYLIRDKLSASEALDQTMKKMRESDLYSERKHWAPFVLLGDDVTLNF